MRVFGEAIAAASNRTVTSLHPYFPACTEETKITDTSILKGVSELIAVLQQEEEQLEGDTVRCPATPRANY